MKTCNKCSVIKELAEFKNDPRNRDGKQGICISCTRKAEKERRDARIANPPKAPPHKICRDCGTEKPIVEFYKDAGYKDGHRPNCKPCKDKHTMGWREANREQYNENQRKQHAKNYQRNRLYRYDITPEEHAKMLEEQKGVCAIPGCGKPPTEKRALATDHCHKTGQVRGLLCYKCNRDMNVVDDLEHLAKLIAYRDKERK